MEEVFRKVPREEIYGATGIQFMPINTLYQLFAAQPRRLPSFLHAAKQLVTIPDLFHYWLSGNAVCEFTNATTTQMVDPVKRTWATGLMQRLDLPAGCRHPSWSLARFSGPFCLASRDIPSLAGTTIIAPACHDTGSAVAAISARDGTAFISSGTWSLVGTELDAPVITAEALRLNFTNEGGVNGTTRLLEKRHGAMDAAVLPAILDGGRASFRLPRADRNGWCVQPPFRHLVDPDDESFLRPADMLAAIDEFCAADQATRSRRILAHMCEPFWRVSPSSTALFCGISNRLAESALSRFVSSGADRKIGLLNQLTADATGRESSGGPGRGYGAWKYSDTDSFDGRRILIAGSPSHRRSFFPHRNFRTAGDRQMGPAREKIRTILRKCVCLRSKRLPT